MTSLTETIRPERTKQATKFLYICRDSLEQAQTNLETALRMRAEFVMFARLHGLTNQQIGDALGITESRVRRIQKHVEAA